MASTNKTYEIALAKLNAYIKKKGLRVSPVRKMVLEEICLFRQSFTADELTQACAKYYISTGTIYNALSLFVAAQILNAINRQRGRTSVEYELTIGTHSKIQIVCTKCGRVTTLHDKKLEELIKDHKYANFNPVRYTMHMYGECKHCRSPKRKEE